MLLTQSNIEKLIYCRVLYDNFKLETKRYGSLPYVVQAYKNSLNENGFQSTDDFLLFNLSMNILEIDYCGRFRLKTDLSKPALCDGCVTRATLSCLAVGCQMSEQHLENRNPDLDYHAGTVLGLGESQAIKEQQDEAVRLGVTPYMYLAPMNLIICAEMETHTPPLCLGVGHFIEEPRFDVFWGMEQFIAIGRTIRDNMKAI